MFLIAGRVMKIIFNGFLENFDQPVLSIQELLDISQEDDPAVIVEVNGHYIYRRDFASFFLHEGDIVEFIHPSFGG